MGTLINAALIVLGGIIGLIFKKAVSKQMEQSIHKATGIAVLIIGICGVLSAMLKANPDGSIASSGELILVISLVVGTFLGEALKLDDRLNRGCKWVENKFKMSGFAAGFIASTMIYCVGAMAIVGSINDGLLGDSSTLVIKGILDGVTSVVLAASLGYGVLFSAVPILIYQGAITLLAGQLEKVLVGDLLNNICMVGYALVMCIGVNFLYNGDKKIKTVNMLPSLLVPVVYAVILRVVG
ncbi:MAG: DUF554 domain-containing protein [Oscillospiraceae bacterium]|nr:DUF554 domain-containing protein [Oscillospiraceae bacterium]